MKVHFWGTRGSLPASYTAKTQRNKILKALSGFQAAGCNSPQAIEAFIDTQLPFGISKTYGTNTPCIEIVNTPTEYILCDAGSGLRDFSNHFSTLPQAKGGCVFHIFLSHLHWDHIMGLPFFMPIFTKEHTIIFHGHHEQTSSSLHTLFSAPFFPVDFKDLKATIHFDIKPLGSTFSIGKFTTTSFRQKHKGDSYAYRFEANGQSLIYSTDSEHDASAQDPGYPFLGFIKEADLLIFDAMYSLTDNKQDWGHSNYRFGIELALRGNVKKLVFFHLDPDYSDEALDTLTTLTKDYLQSLCNKSSLPSSKLQMLLAYDGLTIEV